jgi:soluble lytic murein transglycosylase-like protein
MATTGFLQGFLQTKQQLDQWDQQKAQQQAQLDMEKQRLDLQRDEWKGRQAGLELDNQTKTANLHQMLQQQQMHENIGNAIQNGTLDLSTPEGQKQLFGYYARIGQPDALIKMQQLMQNRAVLEQLSKDLANAGQGQPDAGNAPAQPPAQAQPSLTATVPQPLSLQFGQKVNDIAGRLGMKPADLMSIMHFETGGTFNPAEPNKAGSGAVGLLQFMPKTLAGMGYTPEQVAKMSPEQQLDVVEQYLTPYKGKLGNLQDAYMSVLYPDAIGKSPDTVLFKAGTKAYDQNAGLDMGNKGYVTAGDAATVVKLASSRNPMTQPSPQAYQLAGNAAPAGQPNISQMVAGPGAPPQPSAQPTAPAAPAAPATEDQLRLVGLQRQREKLMAEMGMLDRYANASIDEKQRADFQGAVKNKQGQIALLDEQIKAITNKTEYQSILRDSGYNDAVALKKQQEREKERQAAQQSEAAQIRAKSELDLEEKKRIALQQYEDAQPLAMSTEKNVAHRYFNPQTGENIPDNVTRGEIKQRLGTTAVFLGEEQAKGLDTLKNVLPTLQRDRDILARIYGPGGVFENMKPGERFGDAFTGWIARTMQTNPELAIAARQYASDLFSIRHSLTNESVRLPESELQRATKGMPQLEGIPDSKAVAYGLYNNMIDVVQKRMGILLRNKQFQTPDLLPLDMGKGATTTGGASTGVSTGYDASIPPVQNAPGDTGGFRAPSAATRRVTGAPVEVK